ncbi:TPA: hypothetical protein EYP26_01485 [Candidatus Bathyarchaeota archaeon]|nr:hypothetical protein [Candidatus Bathyarchaeota archaeon]
MQSFLKPFLRLRSVLRGLKKSAGGEDVIPAIISELENVKREVEAIKVEYEKKFARLEREILKIKGFRGGGLIPLGGEKLDRAPQETADDDIESLREEILQTLKGLEEE